MRRRERAGPSRRSAAAVGLVLLAALAPPGGRGLASPRYVPTEDPQHPRIEFSDSLVSLNTQCPVRGGKLSLRYKPVYVNGRPIGFC